MQQKFFFLLWKWASQGAAMLVYSLPLKSRKRLACDVMHTSATHHTVPHLAKLATLIALATFKHYLLTSKTIYRLKNSVSVFIGMGRWVGGGGGCENIQKGQSLHFIFFSHYNWSLVSSMPESESTSLTVHQKSKLPQSNKNRSLTGSGISPK